MHPKTGSIRIKPRSFLTWMTAGSIVSGETAEGHGRLRHGPVRGRRAGLDAVVVLDEELAVALAARLADGEAADAATAAAGRAGSGRPAAGGRGGAGKVRHCTRFTQEK